jgi:hypothetical protein
MAGYSRQKAAEIVTGAVARASDIAAELDQVQAAFSASTGHTHSGVSGEGSPITVLGPAQDIVISGTVLRPKTDDTVDLGTSSLEFKDGYFDGKVYADAINLDGTDITATAAQINKLTSTIAIADGGTGATTDVGARTNLGLGTMATQNAGAVAITGGTVTGITNVGITGGSITGITDLAIADGGTGASTAANARTNLGLGSAALLDSSVVIQTTGNQSMSGQKTFTGTIQSDGNLRQGDADGTTAGNKGLFCQTGSEKGILSLQCILATGNDEIVFRSVRGAVARMRVLADGDVENTNNSYGGISDERLKQDIIDAGPQLEELRDLEVKKYRFKDEPEAPLQIGLIAQDVLDVKPGLVQEGSDGYMSIRYSVLVPILVKAIQELADKVDSLEQRIEDLENEV